MKKLLLALLLCPAALCVQTKVREQISPQDNVLEASDLGNLFDEKAQLRADALKALIAPLHYAASKGYAEAIKWLHEEGEDLHERGDEGWTVLHYAIVNGHLGVIQCLYDLGVNLNEIKVGMLQMFPLHWALNDHFKGTPEQRIVIIRYLVELGLDLEARDIIGRTPLCYAAECGNLDALKCLIALGASMTDVETYGGTSLLHCAALKDRVPVIHHLMKLGANVEQRDKKGDTPLFIARRKARKCLVKEFGAQLEATANDGFTPLKRCFTSSSRTASDIVHYYRLGAKLDCLISEAHVNDPDGIVDTMLDLEDALTSRNLIMLNVLFQKYVDAIPVQIAHDVYQRLNADLTEKLLKYAGNMVLVNYQDNDGYTVLHRAAARGNLGMVQVLLNYYKTNPALKNKEGETAQQIVAEGGVVNASAINNEIELFKRKIYAATALCKSGSRPNSWLPREVAIKIARMVEL